MYTLIVDGRDNTYYSGLTGWSKLEENALWYGDDSVYTLADMQVVLTNLTAKEGNHFYTVSRG